MRWLRWAVPGGEATLNRGTWTHEWMFSFGNKETKIWQNEGISSSLRILQLSSWQKAQSRDLVSVNLFPTVSGPYLLMECEFVVSMTWWESNYAWSRTQVLHGGLWVWEKMEWRQVWKGSHNNNLTLIHWCGIEVSKLKQREYMSAVCTEQEKHLIRWI